MTFGTRWTTARTRQRRELEHLTGDQPLRRRAVWVERSAVIVVLLTCVLGVVGSFFAAQAVNRAVGREDLRITAITTAAAQLDTHYQTEQGAWVADVTWTDAGGAPHRGHVSVPADVPVGTHVPARLTDNGVVRSAPDSLADTMCLIVVVCVVIALTVLAGNLIAREALRALADRMRRESWQVAWAQWNPAAPNREEL